MNTSYPSYKKKTKLAIIHEFFNQIGGAERIFKEVFMVLYPDAHIFTLFYDPERFIFDQRSKITTSFLQYFTFIKNHKLYLPFMPFAIKTFNFKNYELILSSSHNLAKNIRKPKHSLHICYCHTPMRYAWELREQYIQDQFLFLRLPLRIFLTLLALWDKRNARSVDYFIANSENVRRRIKKYYNRDATVIYPAVDCKKFIPGERKDDFYLVVSRLIKPKRINLVIEAFRNLDMHLYIIGTGSEEKSLKKLALPNVHFLGYLPEDQLIAYYQRAKALIFPGIEDFGMTPLEAQACGTPVIAFGKGGALETIIEGKTGHFFHKQTPEAITDAILAFEKLSFNPKDCRKQALRFDIAHFRRNLKRFIDETRRKHHVL